MCEYVIEMKNISKNFLAQRHWTMSRSAAKRRDSRACRRKWCGKKHIDEHPDRTVPDG